MRLPALALLAAAATASAATISYTGSQTDFAGNGAWSDLSLSQFDFNLGTLTGVTVTVNSLVLGGSFNTTASGANVTVNSATGTASIRQHNGHNDLGFTQVDTSEITFTLTPGTPFLIIEDDNATFAISSVTAITNQSSTIASSFFSEYIGNGSVTFQVRNTNPSVNTTTTGDALNDRALASATANMTVTYTYTPVPEPSTYGMILGGLALAGAALRRRQKAAK